MCEGERGFLLCGGLVGLERGWSAKVEAFGDVERGGGAMDM